MRLKLFLIPLVIFVTFNLYIIFNFNTMKNRKRNFNPISLKHILKSFISQKSLQKGMTNVRVCNAWKDVMGENVSKYTTQIRFSRKTLIVVIKSAALGMELSYKKQIIVEKMNKHLNGEYINKIIIR